MALNFPVLLPTTGEALANYNYKDISSGIGIEIFYLGQTNHASFALTSTPFYSYRVVTSGAITSDALLKVFNKNFDVLFNMPKIINGLAILSVPFGIKGQTNPGTYRGEIWASAAIIKLDGSVSSLAAASGAQLSVQNIATINSMSTIGLNIPATNFKKGERLRLDVQAWGIATAGTQNAIYIGHDPKGRASGAMEGSYFITETTIAEFQVPFKIEI